MSKFRVILVPTDTAGNGDPDEKLELERLRSEDTPPPHDYPHYGVVLDPKSKQGRMTLKI